MVGGMGGFIAYVAAAFIHWPVTDQIGLIAGQCTIHIGLNLGGGPSHIPVTDFGNLAVQVGRLAIDAIGPAVCADRSWCAYLNAIPCGPESAQSAQGGALFDPIDKQPTGAILDRDGHVVPDIAGQCGGAGYNMCAVTAHGVVRKTAIGGDIQGLGIDVVESRGIGACQNGPILNGVEVDPRFDGIVVRGQGTAVHDLHEIIGAIEIDLSPQMVDHLGGIDARTHGAGSAVGCIRNGGADNVIERPMTDQVGFRAGQLPLEIVQNFRFSSFIVPDAHIVHAPDKRRDGACHVIPEIQGRTRTARRIGGPWRCRRAEQCSVQVEGDRLGGRIPDHRHVVPGGIGQVGVECDVRIDARTRFMVVQDIPIGDDFDAILGVGLFGLSWAGKRQKIVVDCGDVADVEPRFHGHITADGQRARCATSHRDIIVAVKLHGPLRGRCGERGRIVDSGDGKGGIHVGCQGAVGDPQGEGVGDALCGGQGLRIGVGIIKEIGHRVGSDGQGGGTIRARLGVGDATIVCAPAMGGEPAGIVGGRRALRIAFGQGDGGGVDTCRAIAYTAGFQQCCRGGGGGDGGGVIDAGDGEIDRPRGRPSLSIGNRIGETVGAGIILGGRIRHRAIGVVDQRAVAWYPIGGDGQGVPVDICIVAGQRTG